MVSSAVFTVFFFFFLSCLDGKKIKLLLARRNCKKTTALKKRRRQFNNSTRNPKQTYERKETSRYHNNFERCNANGSRVKVKKKKKWCDLKQRRNRWYWCFSSAKWNDKIIRSELLEEKEIMIVFWMNTCDICAVYFILWSAPILLWSTRTDSLT